MKKNIVLVGMMGSGKSSVARILAQQLDRPMVSTDALIEEKAGMSISDIFAKKGEAHFRKLERSVVKGIAARQGQVVDCGGGVVIDPANLRDLKKTGTLFYLAAAPEFLLEKLKGDETRPLLKTPDPLAKLKELLKAREFAYLKADHTLATTGLSIQDISQHILTILPRKGAGKG